MDKHLSKLVLHTKMKFLSCYDVMKKGDILLKTVEISIIVYKGGGGV